MRWVQRDKDGFVVGTYANRQPGLAEEALPDDHPEVVAFENPPPVVPGPTETDKLRAELDALNGRLVEKAIVTADEIKPAIKSTIPKG